MKSEQHEKHRVNKGVYAFGGCPYCRVHLYLLQLPEHIKTIHKDHQEEWKGADEKDFINKLIFVNNKIQELREHNEKTKILYEDEHNKIIINIDDVKEHKAIVKKVKARRGKYRHMTDEEIKQHKKLLTKERQRRFYENNRAKYKILNLINYKKRTEHNEKKRKGRPPLYNV